MAAGTGSSSGKSPSLALFSTVPVWPVAGSQHDRESEAEMSAPVGSSVQVPSPAATDG